VSARNVIRPSRDGQPGAGAKERCVGMNIDRITEFCLKKEGADD
jgi:hypothetical protein